MLALTKEEKAMECLTNIGLFTTRNKRELIIKIKNNLKEYKLGQQ